MRLKLLFKKLISICALTRGYVGFHITKTLLAKYQNIFQKWIFVQVVAGKNLPQCISKLVLISLKKRLWNKFKNFMCFSTNCIFFYTLFFLLGFFIFILRLNFFIEINLQGSLYINSIINSSTMFMAYIFPVWHIIFLFSWYIDYFNIYELSSVILSLCIFFHGFHS